MPWTKLMRSPKGVLYLVNNYTGDRMAFDMAREMSEADGIRVETLIIDDDVAVKDSTYTAGRRGVAGNFFVIKALGCRRGACSPFSCWPWRRCRSRCPE